MLDRNFPHPRVRPAFRRAGRLALVALPLLVAAPAASSHPSSESDAFTLDFQALAESESVVGECAGVDLARGIEEWQAALGLDDWRIAVRCDMPERYRSENVGLSMTWADARRAVIWVSPSEEFCDPREVVIVHELLHVLLEQSHRADSALVDEQTVQVLTDLIAPRPIPEPGAGRAGSTSPSRRSRSRACAGAAPRPYRDARR